jgi:hypothetical protein
MLIVAIGHRRNVGKDTVGKVIAAEMNLRRVGFADALKDVAHKMFAWAGVKSRAYYDEHYEEKETYLPILKCTVRDLWIKLGNDMRKYHGEVWIRSALPSAASLDASGHAGVLITDLRYPNEGDVVLEQGGVCIKIDRDVEKFNDVADTALVGWAGWTGIFVNDSPSAEDLRHRVKHSLIPDIKAYYGNK